MGCEMFLFRFIGFVQPSPNRGCRFQRGEMGGLCLEHLCGTVAREGSFLAVLRAKLYLMFEGVVFVFVFWFGFGFVFLLIKFF